jgi:uncharacterized protein YbcI
MLAAISNGIVSLHREHYGRGATKARTVQHERYVTCFLEDIFTAAERTLVDAGRFDTVRETRTVFQDTMRPRFVAIVEQLTGRRVEAFMSQIHADPDFALEAFVLDEAPNGAAAAV